MISTIATGIPNIHFPWWFVTLFYLYWASWFISFLAIPLAVFSKRRWGTVLAWFGIAYSLLSTPLFATRLFDYVDSSFVVLLMLPLIAGVTSLVIIRMRKNVDRRLAANLCVKCAYDLRASLGNCPECGTPRKDAS